MNDTEADLAARRLALMQRATAERELLREQAVPLVQALDRADQGLAAVRRAATPPVLAVGGLLAALVLGRRGPRRVLAAGLAAAGLLARVRGARQLFSLLGSLSR